MKRIILKVLPFALFLFYSSVNAQIITFTESGTFMYEIPAGVAEITVEVWGAGGSGGAGDASDGARGGGGGGAYARTENISIMGGTEVIITIGAGGINGNGGASIFSATPITVSADGGKQGSGENGGDGGSDEDSMGQVTFSGGDGGDSAGDNNSGGGGGGGSAFSTGDGLPGDDGDDSVGGSGGNGTGNGGNGGDNGSSGNNGAAPGGGGGGKGSGGASSGNGANGRIVITVTAILPVELMYFNAQQKEDDIQLHWATASEINNEYFSIEYSRDGNGFKEIGRVAGAGNSVETVDYSFTHDNPVGGTNYYRLKQVDYDGAYEYSDIVAVATAKGNENIQIYPNTVKGELSIFTEVGLEKATPGAVYNAVGSKLMDVVIPAQTTRHTIDIHALPAGQYFLQLEGTQDREAIRFVKL